MPAPRPPASRQPALALGALAAAGLLSIALGACGAGPRKASGSTVDAVVLDRGVLVGAQGDRPTGVRALNAVPPRTIDRYKGSLDANLFGDGGELRYHAYLNGVRPLEVAADPERDGAPDLVYPGDRIAWIVRDVSDPSAVPSAVVGLFPAPFDARFTKRRRLSPVRLQCADVRSPGCKAVGATFVKLGMRFAISNLQDTSGVDVQRVYVGPWSALRPAFARGSRLEAALGVEGEAERNGFGFQVTGGGRGVRVAAPFGEAATVAPLGAGTGIVYAIRDAGDAPAWVVSGTDGAGVDRAARSLDEDTLSGRVAAVVPPSGPGT